MIDDDSDLKTTFEALKAEDARSVRPFSSYASADRRNRWSLNVAAIASALALLLLAAVVLQVRSARKVSGNRISQWSSPTASLLRTPGDRFFTRMPGLNEPLIPISKEQRN